MYNKLLYDLKFYEQYEWQKKSLELNEFYLNINKQDVPGQQK